MQATVDSSRDRPSAARAPLLDGRFALAAGCALAGICAALWLLGWRTRGWISAWPPFQDDAYYYLVIARNAAAGHGFSMDQISATNGFQPLWMFLLVPLAWLIGSDPAVYLGTIQGLCVAFFAATGGLVCGLVRARLGLVPALVAGVLLLLPRYLNVAVSGLESAPLLLILVLLILEALRVGSLFEHEPRFADARVGVLVGLLMLARLDSVFIGASLAGYVAWRGLVHAQGNLAARISRTVRKELALFWPAFALLAPYLAWNAIAFGHLMPISGALKTTFPDAVFMPGHLRLEFAGLLVLALAAVGWEIARGNGRDPLVSALAVLAAGLAAHALYTVLYMHWAVFNWHFAAFIPVGVLGAAMLAREAERRLPRALVISALVLLALLQVAALGVSLSRLGRGFTLAGRDAGAWVDANLPPESVLAMKDSGIFSFFARRRVMNLDGVANSFEFADAVCRGRLEEFARARGVAYVAQHSVPPAVQSGEYETYVQVYPCHLSGGHDSQLVLRKELEVYRSAPYTTDVGGEDRLLIWRLSPGGGD
jgi:hypothetical protein